jgi:hypothetical protein
MCASLGSLHKDGLFFMWEGGLVGKLLFDFTLGVYAPYA